MLGAILVNYAKSYFTGALPDMWLFVLGGLFIGVTIFLPKGVVGAVTSLKQAMTRKQPAAQIKAVEGASAGG